LDNALKNGTIYQIKNKLLSKNIKDKEIKYHGDAMIKTIKTYLIENIGNYIYLPKKKRYILNKIILFKFMKNQINILFIYLCILLKNFLFNLFLFQLIIILFIFKNKMKSRIFLNIIIS
jgi:hypothetical protein